MNLLLTSTGLSSPKVLDCFRANLPKAAAECTAMILCLTAEDSEDWQYVEADKQKLIESGIQKITIHNLLHWTECDWKYDIIILCGGNTFLILEALRKHDLIPKLQNALRNDNGLCVTISASSIILGPDITAAGFGTVWDPNPNNLQDLTGMSITAFGAYPHYSPELESEVVSLQNIVNYPIVRISDDEGVFVPHNAEKQYKIIWQTEKE